MSELTPEQVDEIRDRAPRVRTRVRNGPPSVSLVEVLALCDTADAYWGLKAELDRVLGDLSRQLIEANEGRAAAQRELETLRGIAKRTSDWHAVITRTGDGRVYEWEDFDGRVEPMTEAEVAAIYGEKETNDG